MVINETFPANYRIEGKKRLDTNLKSKIRSTMTAYLPALLDQQVLRYCWCALHLAATDKNLLGAAG